MAYLHHSSLSHLRLSNILFWLPLGMLRACCMQHALHAPALLPTVCLLYYTKHVRTCTLSHAHLPSAHSRHTYRLSTEPPHLVLPLFLYLHLPCNMPCARACMLQACACWLYTLLHRQKRGKDGTTLFARGKRTDKWLWLWGGRQTDRAWEGGHFGRHGWHSTHLTPPLLSRLVVAWRGLVCCNALKTGCIYIASLLNILWFMGTVVPNDAPAPSMPSDMLCCSVPMTVTLSHHSSCLPSWRGCIGVAPQPPPYLLSTNLSFTPTQPSPTMT